MKRISVAIDGPAGAGKSTISKACAERLGFLYVDTGAIYRTVGLYTQRCGVIPTDAEAVERLLPEISIEMKHDGQTQRMYLNGEDVTEKIRRHEISEYASAVSAHAAVRGYLLEMQRAFAQDYNVIMDGRDIGTVVLPKATVKIFLTATPEDRARRRHQELLEKGQDIDYETVLSDVIARDERDSSRAVAPLKPAEDAVIADTTGNSLEESIALITSMIEERI